MRLALPISAVLVAAALHLPGAHGQALAVAPTAPLSEESTREIELLDAMVLAVAHVDLPPAVDGDALREFCQGRIAHFKVPRYVKLVDEFPMTVTGKVQKFKMREQAVEELGLADAAATKMA